jgi:elongation factor G
LNLDAEETPVDLVTDVALPTVSLAFKLEDGQYGQLTYIRVYQGKLAKGDTLINIRTGKKIKIGRLVRMHASQMEDISELPAGFIGAMFGIDCASGDTFVTPGLNVTMTSMFVPEPVISLAISPKDNKSEMNMSKALNRFTKEDPTFKSFVNEETGETIISGMGELHLEVYVERMRREYKAEVTTGAPRVAYRETITKTAEFNYTHKKQTGGAGQYGRIAGYIEPLPDEEFIFDNQVTGGSIPTQFIPSCEKGFRACLAKGPLLRFPVTNVRVVINDGASHSVDSSDMAFQAAARGAFKEAYLRAKPVIQEPIMKVVVETPVEFQGAVMGALNQRRGIILGAQDEGVMCSVEAQVPLSEMFGFATVLRSLTQGKAQFTMEFAVYKQVPASISELIVKEAQQSQKEKVA